MTGLTSFQQRLLDFLTGPHPAPITYQELARAMDPDVNPRDRRFKRLTTALYYVNEYEVENDAFMALTLHRIRMQRQRILDAGYILPIVTARGPMCTAGFVRSTTDFIIDLGPGGGSAESMRSSCRPRCRLDPRRAEVTPASPAGHSVRFAQPRRAHSQRPASLADRRSLFGRRHRRNGRI